MIATFHLVMIRWALAFVLAACANRLTAAETVAFRTLAQGAFSGVQEPVKRLIKDQRAWLEFWTQHTSGVEPQPELPPIDFTREMAVVLTMGQKRSGGYAIHVVRVQGQGDKLKISFAQTKPPPGAITIQALTAPFHFVAVPKSDRKAEFTETAPEAAPE